MRKRWSKKAAVSRCVDKSEGGNTILDHFDRMVRIALLVREIILRGDNEAEIADAGGIEPQRVNLVEDAVTDRKPDPALRVRGSSDPALVA